MNRLPYFRSWLLRETSLPAIHAAMPHLTPIEAANALALAYNGLGLTHLNKTAAA